MTRHLTFLALVGTLAIPGAALAQHQQGGAPSSGTATSSGGSSSGGSSSGGSASSGSSSSSGGGSTTSTFSAGSTSSEGRRRGAQPATGRAVARGTAPGAGGTVVIENSGFYPWGYAYGGAIGAYGGYYGGYYGAYDPWYGFFPTYAPNTYGGDNSGAVRLKVKPADASVYVDGFYAGVVADFDGAFQRLHLDRGPHRIEMRETNYHPLSVDVMIQEDFTITYRADLVKQ